MRVKGERLRWSGRKAGVMKREAMVKPLVEGKGLRRKRARDTDSSRRQSGDTGADGAGPPALLLTWPHTCLAYPGGLTNHGPEGCACPPQRVDQSKAAIRGSWPGLMNN